MQLGLIRHGATATNVAGRFNTADEPLAPYEAQRLRGLTLPSALGRRVCVSPLRRCTETALALRLADFETDMRLSERGFGVFEGLTPTECRARFGDQFDAFSSFDEHFAPEGGESRAAHLARVSSWLHDAVQRGDPNVLAITHGGVIDFLYRLATGRALHGGDQIFAGENAALSTFHVNWPQIELISFSRPLTA